MSDNWRLYLNIIGHDLDESSLTLEELVNHLSEWENLPDRLIVRLGHLIAQRELKNILADYLDEKFDEKKPPHIEYSGIALEQILHNTSLSLLDSLDLLYILSNDSSTGHEIYTTAKRR